MTRQSLLSLAALAAVLALSGAATAGEPPTGGDAAAADAAPSVYEQIGGARGVAALVDVLATHLKSDPRTRVAFADNDPKRMRERLGAQFCELAGGPCRTVEPDMRKVHAALDITHADFDVFIALIASSMAEVGLGEPLQRRLLTRFLPMREAIVNMP